MLLQCAYGLHTQHSVFLLTLCCASTLCVPYSPSPLSVQTSTIAISAFRPHKWNAITTKITTSPHHLPLVICCPGLSQLTPYLCLRRHVQFNLTKGVRLKPRNVLGITGTSNLISVIYCVQKPDTRWQTYIDERRLMSQEITVRGIFFPPTPFPICLDLLWLSSSSSSV